MSRLDSSTARPGRLWAAVVSLFALSFAFAPGAHAVTADRPAATARQGSAAPAADRASGDRWLAFSPDGEVTVQGADNCRPDWSTVGVVCVNVGGNGLFVSRVSGIYDRLSYWICNKEFHLWGYYENGQQWHRNGVAGCGVGRVWVDFDLNANMKHGSQICADMKEYNQGSWHANGFPCVTISR
ncbi:hypothetical protein ACF053_05605 [Streptomyces kanasensis]|uniref:hypothetical protein n=1 Tax=Streptomyces kanasensis TaxID=936756 RepID=UPI0036F79311